MHFSRVSLAILVSGAILLAAAGAVVAQGQGGGASAVPIDASGSFEVGGVDVDVRGKDAEAARMGGWRVAQRKAWERLAERLAGRKSDLSDSVLDSIVTGIVVEHEEIGPERYIARLGVLFDRAKAGSILGVSTVVNQSPPMLLVPLEFSGGVGRVFERETDWARAWNRFRSGGSSIDYVRLRGTGPDALLVNAGQTLRRGRNWWRSVLDQYGAADVLVAEAQLRREYPGGPVVGVFAAHHGPDRTPVTSFALRVDNGDALDRLLDAAVQRIDAAYRQALASGLLKTDTLLSTRPPAPKSAEEEPETEEPGASPSASPGPATVTSAAFTVQVETPSAASVTASEASVRGVPGVRSATTTSLALGGISVIRVTYDGSIGALRAALEARGWQVQEGAGVLRIRRPGPAPATQPSPQASGAAAAE